MAQIFNERFDTVTNGTALTNANTAFNVVNLTNVAITEDTSTAAQGAGSMKVVQTANFGTGNGVTAAFSSTNTLYRRFCVQMAVLPSGGTLYIASCQTGGTVNARLAINSTGQFIIQNGTATIATSTTALTTSAWWRLEWDVVGTTATLRIYTTPAGTTPTETISGTMTGNTFTTAVTGIVGSSNNTNATIWFDELVDSTTSTPGPVSQAATGTGSVVFTGSGTAAGAASGTGSVVITGTGTPAGAATGTASVVFIGSGAATTGTTAVASGTASIVIRGYGGAVPGLVIPPPPVTYTYALFHTISNHNVPLVGADTPSREYVPAIYFNDPIPAGENLFVNQLGAVTYEQPADWADVWAVYLGGHLYTITPFEVSLLTSAGFGGTITTVTSGTPPVFNGGVGPLSGVLVGAGAGDAVLVGAGFGTGPFGVQGFGV